MKRDLWQSIFDHKTSRRTFLAGTAAGCAAAVLAADTEMMALWQKARAGTLSPEDAYILNKAENTIYSCCLQCNTGCGIKVKSKDGLVMKIDGNPYAPSTMYPHPAFSTSSVDAAKIDGAICPKGQAGIEAYYDPYRIRKVLKRAGKRGENKWVSISFSQAMDEIAKGGKLFANVAGEENRVIDGLDAIWAVRDPKLAKDMSDAVAKIWAEKDKDKKKALVGDFQSKFKEHLDKMIDPEHPDLGPKNNQFTFWWGRLKDGRGEFIKRFTLDSLGSFNAHGHTTVCQGSLYFSGKAMSEQWKYDAKKNAMSWMDGKKFYWQAELERAEFVLFVGSNVFEANYGPPFRVPRITENVVEGKMKYAVLDPRCTKAVAHAWKWLPVKPGADAAVAMGMIRWMLENKRFDEKYLKNANKAAAKAMGEPTWSNGPCLVKLVNGKPTSFLRAHEAGFAKEMKQAPDGKEYFNEQFVVLSSGKPMAVDVNDEKTPVYGDLFVEGEVNGIKVKSVLQLLLEESRARSLADYAKDAGIETKELEDLAKEFSSHGKRAVADIHRGVSQHTNGFYNVLAWNTVNLLVGNYDWRGGFIAKSDYNHIGGKEGQPFKVADHPKKMGPFGVSSIRTTAKYEDTTVFSGYPAKRPWFPLISDIYQEVLPSAQDMYPYQTKALFLYMGTPIYSLPAAQANIDTLLDLDKVPLFVTIDTTIGETSLYADYIIPDLTYLERWEFHGGHPSMPYKTQPIRQPAAQPLTENVQVYGQDMPLGLEAFVLGLAEKMSLPGFGPDGYGAGKPITHPDHIYLKQVANVAFDGKAVPDAGDAEVNIFLEARKHLPKSVFDVDRWRASCGDANWRKVIYVLNRGGRFEDFNSAWDGDKVKNKYGTLVNMYMEKTAAVKNAMTGKNFSGMATYIPEIRDCTGNVVDDGKDGYEFTLITNKVIQHTKSRTASQYWLLALEQENSLLMNAADAQRMGFSDGAEVKVVSPTNPDGIWKLGPLGDKKLVGKVRITEGMRPGVVSFSLGSGHFACGAGDVIIDGKTIKGDVRRAKGIHANAAMRVDPVLNNTGLQDVVGGSICFYDTKVKLIKV